MKRNKKKKKNTFPFMLCIALTFFVFMLSACFSKEAGNTYDTDTVGKPDEPVTGPAGPIQYYSDYTVAASLVSAGDNNFKTVGYFPFYSAHWTDNIQWDCLTHIVYAFAIPDGQGGLQPLDNVELVEELISKGHQNGVKVLLGVGGWEYYGDIMEYKFDANTATPELTDAFTDDIVALVEQYGFDGVDMDWEHPRAGTDSWKKYEAMMIQLREKLGNNRLLTGAVLSGVNTDGTVFVDAAAHTANVMAVCDWFNVMAYDCICTLDFCEDVAAYWCDTRGLPENKVCMGVPFYAFTSNLSYKELVDKFRNKAVRKDFEGTDNYHNGIPTIQAKTRWAMQYGLGGMMIWALPHDTTNPSTSLLRAINNVVNE
ncbi:MAG: glycosyl hydrolase family 18 protein [Lachnospiraceae bacterium]